MTPSPPDNAPPHPASQPQPSPQVGKLRHRAHRAPLDPVPITPLCSLSWSPSSRASPAVPAVFASLQLLGNSALPSQLGFPSRSLLNPLHLRRRAAFLLIGLLPQARTMDLPIWKNSGGFGPSWGDFDHPRGDYGHRGRSWPTQEVCWQRSWRPAGAASPSRLLEMGTSVPLQMGQGHVVSAGTHWAASPLLLGSLGCSWWAVNIPEGETSSGIRVGSRELRDAGCSAPLARHRCAWSHLQAKP